MLAIIALLPIMHSRLFDLDLSDAGADRPLGHSSVSNHLPAALLVGGALAAFLGTLDAFLDLNDNGSFADAGEKIFNSVPLVAGQNVLQATTPTDAVLGTTYARFRVSTAGDLGCAWLGNACNPGFVCASGTCVLL